MLSEDLFRSGVDNENRRQISISWLSERKVLVKAVLQVMFESECARK